MGEIVSKASFFAAKAQVLALNLQERTHFLDEKYEFSRLLARKYNKFRVWEDTRNYIKNCEIHEKFKRSATKIENTRRK